MVVLKYEQPSILKYIKDHKLNMEVYYPANTLEIGKAIDELINMGASTKEPKHIAYRIGLSDVAKLFNME